MDDKTYGYNVKFFSDIKSTFLLVPIGTSYTRRSEDSEEEEEQQQKRRLLTAPSSSIGYDNDDILWDNDSFATSKKTDNSLSTAIGRDLIQNLK